MWALDLGTTHSLLARWDPRVDRSGVDWLFFDDVT
jgi:hypothetical protein